MSKEHKHLCIPSRFLHRNGSFSTFHRWISFMMLHVLPKQLVFWKSRSAEPTSFRLRSCANTQGCYISWADLAEKKRTQVDRRDGKEFVAQKLVGNSDGREFSNRIQWWILKFFFPRKRAWLFKRSILPLGHCLAITQRFPPVEGDSERLWSLDKHGRVSLGRFGSDVFPRR